MPRTSLLLGTLFVGTIAGCSSNSASDDTGPGSGFDASSGADATVADAAADTAIGPGTDAADSSPATSDDSSSPGDDGSAVDAGSSLVTPASLDFGLVGCGSSAAAQTFNVVNTASYPVTWSATLGLGAASAFKIAPASGSLAANASTQVTVTPVAVPTTSSTAANALGDVATVSVGSATATVTLTETAEGAVLAFEPTSVAFGPVPLSLGPQSLYFAVQNSGNVAANVALALTGDPSFTLPDASTTETLSVASGTISDSQVTYAPTATTSVTGSIALTLGGTVALCGPLPAALPVSGNGTNGQVGVSPAMIVFGNGGLVPCGTTAAPAIVTLTNTGSAPYNWTAELLHGGSFYTVSPASGTLTAGASAPLTVTPKAIPTTSATTSGEYDDTLTITTNVVGDSPHTVSLEETAQGAILARSTGSLGFGNVGVGGTIANTTSVSFSNTGNVNATLTFTNGNAAFVQSTPLTVGAGTFVPEAISFSPTAIASYSDIGTVTLAATDDGGVTPLCASLPGNLGLSGTGTLPTLSASPSSLNFGYVPCGQAGTALDVTITNNGPPAASYTASLLKGVGSYFTVSSLTPPGTIPTGGTFELMVTPQTLPMPGSTAGNAYGDTLQVVTSTGYIVDVGLSQTALGAVLSITTPPGFGTVADGATATEPVTVTNTGTAPATVTLTPSLTPTFGVSPATTVIPASGAGLYTVSFSPPSEDAGAGVDAGVITYAGTLALDAGSTLLCAALPANVALSGKGN